VYPQPVVAEFVRQNFIPVRLHVKQDAAEFQRVGGLLNAQWTPTTLIVEPPATERHRIEGFLPVEDFLSQLALGLAKAAFARGDFAGSERAYALVVDKYPNTDAAAESQYWAGVSRYKATGDASALTETARRFKERYSDSTWAKKASVWAA
jgi:TolA-binding protein